ncbi:SanA/YdcF family protein [Paenibacillus piri]|uniref:DUF218 domain-containing protein n=1 Tax=Paenibacillus piri TaxID=2547395 RepID=A0A4R5KAW8_9BACL|nr:ElyC/SanA/YdcF family protein [Paenibacillus piri]TDF92176.1 hypothetical protein E1757_30760 [Paenibacillus piri]
MKFIKRKRRALILLLIIPIALVFGIDAHVRTQASNYIVSPGDAPQADAILVLGARVYPDGNVSPILGDRLQVALELEQSGKSDTFIVSGDHGQVSYDEVNAMRTFLEARNVKPERIFMDHAGFSTYESMYRARDIFQARKIIIVTQQYHLMRAVYAARQLGLDAYGVASDKQAYTKMAYNQTREVLARNKDFMYLHVLRPKPTYLGEPIPITGDGRLTADRSRK